MKSKLIAIFILFIFYLSLSSVEAKQIDDVLAAVAALELRVAELESDLAIAQSDLAANTAADAASHHAKYTDGEAQIAVGPHFSGNHNELTNVTPNQHHVPAVMDLTEIEADLAVLNEFYDDYYLALGDPYFVRELLQLTSNFLNQHQQMLGGPEGVRDMFCLLDWAGILDYINCD